MILPLAFLQATDRAVTARPYRISAISFLTAGPIPTSASRQGGARGGKSREPISGTLMRESRFSVPDTFLLPDCLHRRAAALQWSTSSNSGWDESRDES